MGLQKENMVQAAIKSGAELIVLDDGLQDTSIVKMLIFLFLIKIREMEIIKSFLLDH